MWETYYKIKSETDYYSFIIIFSKANQFNDGWRGIWGALLQRGLSQTDTPELTVRGSVGHSQGGKSQNSRINDDDHQLA